MKIGILGALPEEIDRLHADLKHVKETMVGGRSYLSGELLGFDCVIVFSRWGKVAAASTATVLIDRFGVDLVVFLGVAGAAVPHLQVGDIVIADTLVQHDLD